MNMFIRRSNLINSKVINPYLWFIPAFLIIGFVFIYPMLWSFYLSLTSWNPIRAVEPVFIGLENYRELFRDVTFREAIFKTIYITAVSVILQFFIGFGLALLLNQNIKGRYAFIIFCMTPMTLTPSIVGLMWKQILHNEWGILNYFLKLIGLNSIAWLSDPKITLTTIIMIDVWQHSSFFMLFLLAGLQSVPGELIESAIVDGANVFQLFLYITLPWMKPLISISLLFRVMFTLRIFDIIYGIWRSAGPLNEGMTLGVFLYDKFMRTWQIGLSSGISYILLILTFILGSIFAISMIRKEGV